jgi:hypothetical protein
MPAAFTPVNSLETKLRAVLTDKHTPLWNFYTPLGAAPLWVIVQRHPELDGSDEVAPPGQNPGVCVFHGPKDSFIGIYTSRDRAEQAFKVVNASPQQMTIVSAPGYQLLKYLSTFDAHLWINCGLTDCQYGLDADMVDILLSRPEPDYDGGARTAASFEPTDEADRHLAPLREFLARQPRVRAAWIYRQTSAPAGPGDRRPYEISLVMDDPEEKCDGLLREVETRAKALTPVEMEWVTSVMMADDQSLRNLSQKKPPFYARPDFLKS